MNLQSSRTDTRANNIFSEIIKQVILPWNNISEDLDLTIPGGRIRQARQTKKMTICQLAAGVQITPEALSMIEHGKINPSLPRLRSLASILGTTVIYLGCFENLPTDTLGQKITKARLSLGMQKTEFAALIGVNQRTLWGWERDLIKPDSEHKGKLMSFLEGIL